MKALSLAVILILVLTGCASSSDMPSVPAGTDVMKDEPGDGALVDPMPRDRVALPSIDHLGLHRHLGLERVKDDLGYLERAFDTCSVGYGYSASNNCRRAYFVAINFQMLCRDTDGTVSTAVSRADMKPLSGRTLNWSIQGTRGTMRLDGEGFGQIKRTFAVSQKLQRLKLSVDNDFVYIRAGEVKRLVTPKNWCN